VLQTLCQETQLIVMKLFEGKIYSNILNLKRSFMVSYLEKSTMNDRKNKQFYTTIYEMSAVNSILDSEFLYCISEDLI